MDADDLRLFEDSLRRIARAQTQPDFDAALDAVGWLDALRDEPHAATSVALSVQGELGRCSSALDDVVAAALEVVTDPNTAVVLPRVGSHDPPGVVTNGRTRVRGIGTRRALDAQKVIAVVGQNSDLAVVKLDRGRVDARPVSGMDPDGGWVEISADLPSASGDAIAAGRWSAAVTAAQLGIASELVANSRSMLALARDHALERVQFGRPIASFQAIRHRLADALFAVESGAGSVAASVAEPTPFTAAMAKAIAGRTAATVARHSQQVLAGMGFTSEHRFHRYFRRALVLDQLFGSGAALSEEIGSQVLRSGVMPTMLPL